jgi:hypothetical protein
MSALDIQVGGEYYKRFHLQPYEFFLANGTPHHIAAIIRRIVRYDQPKRSSHQELSKILHECDLIIELQTLTFYQKIKFTILKKFDKIPLQKFLDQDVLSPFQRKIIRTIYDYDTLSGNGMDDIKFIKNIVRKKLISIDELDEIKGGNNG